MPINRHNPPSVDPAYSAKIAELVDEHLGHNAPDLPIAPLLEALGCNFLWFQTGELAKSVNVNGSGWHVQVTVQPDPKNEALTRQTLAEALKYYVTHGLCHHTDSFALLHGLYQNERWRHCLESADGAYGLASLCVAQSFPASDTHARALSSTWLLAILNEWIRPASPYTERPSLQDLCGALFGEAWHQFEVEHAEIADRRVPRLIYATRPTFRPGLVADEFFTHSIDLPPLDGP